MNGEQRALWPVGVLFIALVVSFALCVASDLRFSATLYQAGIILPSTSGFITLGMSWLLGHGLHGAAVVAVPLFFLTRSNSAAGEVD